MKSNRDWADWIGDIAVFACGMFLVDKFATRFELEPTWLVTLVSAVIIAKLVFWEE